MTESAARRGRRILVVGEALTAFMSYPGEAALSFHGPLISGAPVIFASAAARLGADVTLAARVGDDAFGSQFVERMARDGVSLQRATVDPDHRTALVFIWYRGAGQREFAFYLNATAALEVSPESMDEAVDPDWLHVSGATLFFGGATAEACWAAVERALRDGTPISFDPNVRPGEIDARTLDRFETLLQNAHVVLASDGELAALGTDVEAITARGGTVCTKHGPQGAVVWTPEGSWSIPAPAVDEVDPDGAGDIFAAGYVVAVLSGLSPAQCATVAVNVASESVAVIGPLESDVRPLAAYLGAGRA